MNRLVAVVGATAAGKTALAVYLAQRFDGEIVNADSRQVYRYMNIGTNKPSPSELASAPHHLIDIINPGEAFSLARYQELAYRTINDIQARNKLPLLVGGSGQYVWAVLEGWQIPRIEPDIELRKHLENRAAGDAGRDELYRELTVVDAAAARIIGPHNIRRIIRALEVHHAAGIPISELQKKVPPAYDTTIIGLHLEREELYRRIDARVDRMVDAGFVREVENLLRMGYASNLPAMSSLGYRQMTLHLSGELTLDEAVRQTKTGTHRYARQQENWFRRGDQRIHWLDAATDARSQAESLLHRAASL